MSACGACYVPGSLDSWIFTLRVNSTPVLDRHETALVFGMLRRGRDCRPNRSRARFRGTWCGSLVGRKP